MFRKIVAPVPDSFIRPTLQVENQLDHHDCCLDYVHNAHKLHPRLDTLARLGITHRRTAYHHLEGSSYLERFHRSLKAEEVWIREYRSLGEAQAFIAT